MNDLANFKENLKDSSISNSLLDYVNYLHETKTSYETLKNGNDALAKCEVMCAELYANKIKKGEVSQDDIESFEALLPTSDMLVYKNNNLDLARNIIKENNAVALTEYETKFESTNNSKGLRKIA